MAVKLPLFAIGTIFLAIYCSTGSKPIIKIYSELKDSKPFDTLAWKSVTKGMNVSLASIDKRYPKNSVPELKKTDTWEENAWKGERLNAQIVLWSAEPLEEIHCVVSALNDSKGNSISGGNIRPFFVRYVMTDEFADGCGKRKPTDYDSSIVADVLDPIPYFNIEANTTRPVWITIDVPEDCKAGNYAGTITIDARKQKKQKVNIRLSVYNRILPKSKDWSFHLDLWQNPFAVARYNKVDVWSKEHFDLMRPLMEMLANAGQKCITASIVHKPWGGQTYDYFESLIDWKKSKDGTWTYNYTAFDNWVEFAMECGITEQINCYSMIPWGNKFTYFDELAQKDTVVEAVPGSKFYNELWTPFLKQFVVHLKEKDWQNITAIAMDERTPEEMGKMIALIKTIAPELKITLAGGFHKKISNDLYDLCVASANIVPKEDIEKRSAKGFKTTFYVCCNEHYPNNFTFSPPAESAYMGWYAAAKGFDGFLRWAYNSWVENPLTDSRFRKWPAGDTYFVYPGSRSSIRFERLREGLQDYEKIKILKEELMNDNRKESTVKLELLEKTLKTFEISKLANTPAEHFVNEGKKVLTELSGD